MSHPEDVSEPAQDVESTTLDSEARETFISRTLVASSHHQGDESLGQDVRMDLLFQDVVFYLNPFLGKARSVELEALLCADGAQRAGACQDSVSNPTHIITDDLDIPDYKHAVARGIHIVKPEWAFRSVKTEVLQDPQYFSADPSMIFSGVVLATTKLPLFDRQLIREALEDYGGIYSPTITPEVTHLLALSPSGSKYDLAMERKELGIKVVLPHWFHACCNLKRLLPEVLYLFPDPPLQNQDHVVTPDQNQSYAPQLYSNSASSVVSFLNSPNDIKSKFLDGLYILLEDDMNVIPERRIKIEEKIEEAGGIIVNEYSGDMTDILICPFRSGDAYIKASKNGKIVASIDWLLHVLQTGELPSPKASLLHYPVPRKPIAGMSSIVVSVSNYMGPVRDYLKRLIYVAGASYKPTMGPIGPQRTTHLICGNASGDKFGKAHEWNMKVVNHIWLEECFQAWSLQSETKPRYTYFPPHNQLSQVFGSKILPDMLEDWIGPDKEEEVLYLEAQSKRETEPLPLEPSLANALVETENGGPELAPSVDQEYDVDTTRSSDEIESSPPPLAPSKTAFEDSSATHAQPNTYTPIPAASAPSSPKSSYTAEGLGLGSVRVVSRKRGAALQASKALQKIVPDMNEFQEELRDEKKASKRKKKHVIAEESIDDASMDMHVDQTVSLPTTPTKKPTTSPMKRKRISVGSVERSTPMGSEDEEDHEDHESEANTSGPKISPKKTKRGVRSEKDNKEDTMMVATNAPEIIAGAGATTGVGKMKRVRYITTGVKDQSVAQIKALKALGIMPTTAVEKCTHLVATSIARTGKFLIALLQGKIIVHEDWFQACIDANAILDEDDFRIKDSANELKFGMKLYKSLERARERHVFENCVFYLSPSMKQDMPGLKSVIEAGGGKASTLLHTGLSFLKDRLVKANNTKSGASKEDSHSEDDDQNDREEVVAVVSSEKDKDMWQPILGAGAHIYSHDLISIGVLTQKLDLSTTHALA
ncbi:hypothetical protein EDD21DRAFT_361232 [Dissophora ornata]|nr:hypothetical protein EDD21DRAFT_361232 [Dissophora ornata]